MRGRCSLGSAFCSAVAVGRGCGWYDQATVEGRTGASSSQAPAVAGVSASWPTSWSSTWRKNSTKLIPYNDMAEWHAKVQEPSGRYAEVLVEIDRRETMIDQLLDDLDAGLITRDRYLDRLRSNNIKLTTLREELGELEAVRNEFIDVLYTPPSTEDLGVVVERGMSKEEHEDFRRALRAFVERIEVGPSTRQIPQVPHGPRADLSRVKITPKRH